MRLLMFATGPLQDLTRNSMMHKRDIHGKPCNIKVALTFPAKAQDLQQQMLEREKDHKAMSLGQRSG